jgi:hypothetical protein
MRLGFFLLALLAATLGFSQKKKQKQAADASSIEPFYPQKEYAPKVSKKKKKKGLTRDAQDRYQDRVDQLARNRRANELRADNPKSSDPQYFGHKRLPKKRPPEKMKFCKVCQIRH